MRKLGSVLTAAIIILGSTGLAVVFADMVVAVEHHRRPIAADLYGVMNWFAGLDPFVVAGAVGVALLVAVALLAPRIA
jgi:hypothetical protein